MRNFYTDYSGGGASTRQGTRYILQALSAGSRLVPFQPSSTLSYVLVFGQNTIRFISNGAPILEAATTISGATNANPGVITDTAHGYKNGDWVFITGVGGMVQLNGNYYIVAGATTNTFTLTDLFGNVVNTTSFGAYTSGGSAQRVYTLASPYATQDLFPNPATGNPGIKWAQDVTSLIICHPSYPPSILTILTANNWTFSTITFGPTIGSPTNVTLDATNLPAGSWAYSYLVTAVDVNGQESAISAPGTLTDAYEILSAAAGQIKVTWTAVTGAQSYNVYKASPTYSTLVPAGVQFGFVGNVTGTSFVDAFPGTAPDFSQAPPIVQNPFLGASVTMLNLTVNAAYTAVPSVTIAAPSSGGVQATGYASLQASAVSVNSGGAITSGSGASPVGQTLLFPNGIVLRITSATGSFGIWSVTGLAIVNPGSLTSGSAPATEASQTINSELGWSVGTAVVANVTWDIGALVLAQGGAGYTTVPAVTLSGSATATATLGTVSGGNPGIPTFFQERLMLAAQQQAVQSYNLSQPASFFNFNVSNPTEDDDAISGTIISEELNDIRGMIQVPTGVILLTGKGAWLLNGGGGISTNNPITPSNQTAQSQAFNGANDMRPVKVNLDVLYVTNKGNYVRDLAYNIYANIYTGTDISVLSNHLFFGHYLLDWAWAEEPFKTLWAIREDGQMLSLGFVKEQDLIGWAHHDTNGQFTSVCSVIENVGGNIVDAVYVIVQRFVNGQYVSYIERMADRYFTYGYEDSWSVDCALQTVPQASPTGTLTVTGNASAVGNSVTLTDTMDAPFTSTMATNGWAVRAGGGIYKITAFTSTSVVTASVVRVPAVLNLYTGTPFQVTGGYSIWQPVTTVTGLTQLVGQSVVGVADGTVIGPAVVSASGSVTLTSAASKVTLGLSYLPQLQTLPLELGEPTVQSKRKKENAVTLRVADTLGLQVGTTFANCVTMKDLQLGAIPSQSNGPAQVTDLVNPTATPTYPITDARQILDPLWQEPGQICIQQTLPYPATILGIIPEVAIGDTQKAVA